VSIFHLLPPSLYLVTACHPYLEFDASPHLHGLVLGDAELTLLPLAHVQALFAQRLVQFQNPVRWKA
jgi:hypothetical protein